MPIQALAQVVQDLPTFHDPNLIVGAEHFSDAGVYRVSDQLALVQSLDFFAPLVEDPYQYGQIAAANSMSDVFAMGGRPITAMNVVGFPDDELGLDVLGRILAGGAERVLAAGAVVVGGHSVRAAEISYGLSVTGVVDPEEVMTNQAAAPGDVLVLTKALGTGFVTTALRGERCPDDVSAAALESMIQLNRTAAEAALKVGGRAATDITGFGLLGHALEMARASEVAIVIDRDRLPLLPGAAELAHDGNRTRANATNRAHAEPFSQWTATPDAILDEFLVDPQTSGGLLVALPADAADTVVSHCRDAGQTAAAIVGSVRRRDDAYVIIE